METQRAVSQTAARALIVVQGVASILDAYGEKRPGTKETPNRVARMYEELLTPPPFDFTMFDANGYDQMIVQTGIEFYSLCEHHLVPFFGTVAVGYIPSKRIVGLSKLARTVEHFARRLQTQEYMTQNIAHFLKERLQPKGVGVIVTARHLCQEMRGVKCQASTTTSAMLGLVRKDQKVREEFLHLTSL